MNTHESLSMRGYDEAFPSMNVEQAIRLAETSIKNGNSTPAEQDEAVRAAQRAGVTNGAYLRAHLLFGIVGDDRHRIKEWLQG